MVSSKKIKSKQAITNGDDFGEFSPLEENVARMCEGVSVDLNAPLKRKSEQEPIKKRLLELEQEIIKKARTKGII